MKTIYRRFLFAIIVLVLMMAFSVVNHLSVSAQVGTLTLSATLTQTVTPTPTFTPTVTASMTATATHSPTPSTTFTPTYAVATDLAEMKVLLNRIETNTSPGHPLWGFLRRMGEDNAFTFVWTLITQPLLSLLWVLLASIPVVSRFAVWWHELFERFRRSRQRRPDPIVTQQGESIPETARESLAGNFFRRIVDFINVFVLVVVILLFFPFAVALGSPALATQPVVPTTSAERTLPTVTAVNASTPSPTPGLSIGSQRDEFDTSLDPESELLLLVLAEALGLGLLAFLVVSASRLYRYQARMYDASFPRVNVQELWPTLLPAGFVTLIVLILPAPVDSLLLPLLVPFMLFGFFDVIRAYPNMYWKQLVSTQYSKIIYVAEFGAWFSFLSVLTRYADPFVRIGLDVWQQASMYSRWENLLTGMPQIIWECAPVGIALFLAIRPSRRITEFVRANQIAAIRQSAQASNDMPG